MDFTVKLDIYEYYCDDCSENFYLQTLKSPSILVCPHCREGDQVAINSKHLAELMSSEQ